MLCHAVLCCVQVCPANWKPGDKTIVADPEKSLEYFEAANKVTAAVSTSMTWRSSDCVHLLLCISTASAWMLAGSHECMQTCGVVLLGVTQPGHTHLMPDTSTHHFVSLRLWYALHGPSWLCLL